MVGETTGLTPYVSVVNKPEHDASGMDPMMAAMMGNQNNQGAFGGMGGMSMLLPWLFLFARGGMFGANGENGYGGANPYEVALGQANATNASFQNVNTQISGLGQDISNQINASNLASANYAFQNLSNMQNLAFGIQNSTQQSFSETQLQNFQNYAALSQQAATCCCNTQLRIEQTESALSSQLADVNYQSAVRTASIIANTNEQTQKILDKMCDTQINDLQRQLGVCQETSLINNQTAAIINAINSAVAQFLPLVGSTIASAVSSGLSGVTVTSK